MFHVTVQKEEEEEQCLSSDSRISWWITRCDVSSSVYFCSPKEEEETR